MLSPLRIKRGNILFLLKKLFCIFLIYSGICRLFTFIHRNSVKILVYHGIINGNLPAGLNYEGLHLDLESFKRHIAYLRKRYHVLDLNEFIEHLKEGKPVPRYSVVLTFDDGYKNNYENLKDIILKYKIPVSMFLATDYIGTPELLWLDKLEMAFFDTARKGIFSTRSIGVGKIEWDNDREKMQKYVILKNHLKKMPFARLQEVLKELFSELAGDEGERPVGIGGIPYTRLLNWDEVRELTRYGVRFGSHTCRHEILTALSDSGVKETLENSFSAIKGHSGNGGIPFAYPNGNFNDEIKKAVARAGYNCALTTMHGFNSSGSDPYALRRNEIGNKGDIHIFIATLSGTLDFIKSFARLPKRHECIY